MQTSQLQNVVCSVKGVHVQLDVCISCNAPWNLVIIIYLIHKNTKSFFMWSFVNPCYLFSSSVLHHRVFIINMGFYSQN